METKTVKIEKLTAESEYRFEVGFQNQIKLKLLSGAAEIFGTELVPQHYYTFEGCKSAVYTWSGCELEVIGQPDVAYIGEETTMHITLNTIMAICSERENARHSKIMGPRVAIFGPQDAGKTSLIKTLIAYGLRLGWPSTVALLDPKENLLTGPGTISSFTVSTLLDIEKGFGSSGIIGSEPIRPKIPLAYFYGKQNTGDSFKLFKNMLSRLGLVTLSRLKENKELGESGLLVDTCGNIDQNKGYDLMKCIISDFEINRVIVIGNERLYNAAQKILPSSVQVVKVPKSGGCVERDEDFFRIQHKIFFQNYFNGAPDYPLNPHSITVDMRLLVIYRYPEEVELATSVLPIGQEVISNQLIPETIEQDSLVVTQNSVLAVSHLNISEDSSELSQVSIKGFVFVSDINEAKQRVTLLIPNGSQLPPNPLILGDFKWQDE